MVKSETTFVSKIDEIRMVDKYYINLSDHSRMKKQNSRIMETSSEASYGTIDDRLETTETFSNVYDSIATKSEELREASSQTSNSPIAKSNYGYSSRLLNDIVNNLRQYGYSKEFKLPHVAVIGKQSAGKSSLIEGISRIMLPRASGTCTRCPIEVRLHSSREKAWRCKVFLDYNNEPGTIKERYQAFTSTENPSEVELILRQAQVALVHRVENIRDVLELSKEECDKKFKVEEGQATIESQFSKNCIVVEISGADADLTFIDLPGLIGNVFPYDSMHY